MVGEAGGFAVEFPNDLVSLGAVQEALAAWAEERGLSPAARHRVALVLDELGANVLMHGHPAEEQGRRSMRVTVSLAGRTSAEVVLEDDGTPFDPRGQAGDALAGSLEDAKIGGLGLLLLERMSSRIAYERTPEGRNRTLVELRLPGGAQAVG